MRRLPIFACLLIFLLYSCKEKKPLKPAYLLTEEQMVSVMVDMHLVETAHNLKLIGPDSTNAEYKAYFNSIFASHEISKTDFDSSLFYYSTRTQQMNAIYDKVLEDLYELESQVRSDQ
ncbi:MAG: hypothetical protein RL266_1717 [Bacteroidota bacterium]|jgi:hypothetical protein